MFSHASAFNQVLSFDTSSVTDMRYMFSHASAFNQVLSFDTSSVTDMRYMFSHASAFNQVLSFDTSSVTDMRYMFSHASAFNQVLSFDTSSVTSMAYMLESSPFDKPLSLDTSSVTDMGYMFDSASAFNQPLGLNTSSVTNMHHMLSHASAFNQPLSFDTSMASMLKFSPFDKPLSLDTSSVTDMGHMFDSASAFNQPLSLNTSSVTDMRYMFSHALAFNHTLSFDTSSVKDMSFMFWGTAFNQRLSLDTSSATDLSFMFRGATFNQPLHLNLISVKDLSYMFWRAAFERSLSFNISSVNDTDVWGMFGVLSRNTACTADGVEFSHTEAAERANAPGTLDGYVEILPLQCPSPAFAALEQGVDHLNQSLVLDQSVQLVVLVSGEMPFEVEEALELPAGRNLTIVGNSSRNGDARVKVNITDEFKVNGALQLERLELSGGSGNASLVNVLDGGAAEIVRTEFRVHAGAVAIAVNNGSLVLREAIIAGEAPASMAVTLALVASGSVGDFSDADRAGLIQAIASLADVRPAAVGLTLEAAVGLTLEAAVRLSFHICVSGSAKADATSERLRTLLPNANEAAAKLDVSAEAAPDIRTLDGDSHCLRGGIALQPPPPPPSPPPHSGRRLSDLSPQTCEDCMGSHRWPATDRPSCFMKRKGIATCVDAIGMKGYCAGGGHQEDGRWFDDAHCQQTCSVFNHNCCRPPSPSPPAPSPPCAPCGDKAPRAIRRHGGKCGDWRSDRAVELQLDKYCSKEKWIKDKICEQSCSDASCGYTNCCLSPPSPPRPVPSPPSSPAPPPSIAAVEFADADSVKIVGAKNGHAIISPRFNSTCIVDGIKTVVKGDCVSSSRRLAVSTLGDIGDTRRAKARQLKDEEVHVHTETGGFLNLTKIVAGKPDVQEVQLPGGGERPFEIEGTFPLLAGRTLRITAIGDSRVKVNVTGEVLAKVSGTLRLRGLDMFSEPIDDGCGGCDAGFPPLLDILEGGTVEIVESELRVPLGELAIAVKGSLVLREAIIAGAPFNATMNSGMLNESASDTFPLAAMELQGSQDAAWFITGVKQGMRHHQCSLPEVFFENRCQ